MLSILNAPTHLGWIVWAWKFVFGTSHGTSACVEDLEDLVSILSRQQ